ncbi:MAG TPA: hypothetical protein VNX68_04305 [Nitrosopumilaceae archaeon]|jgi:hypothetical protein|nr:hypothetical protein [Nitrosopumilaceae archaeon]
MKKEIKPLSEWQKKDLKDRVENIQLDIKSITESFYHAKYELEREIRYLQNQLDGKEPYDTRIGGFEY